MQPVMICVKAYTNNKNWPLPMTIRDYSTTPGNNNSAPPNGWPEGQAASTVNDCARQMMAELRESFEELPYFDYGDDPTRVDNDTFTLVGDLTARYPVGARVKLVGATTGFGRISASAFGAVTTIDVVMDSGNVPTSLVRVAVKTELGSTVTPAAVTLSASAGTSAGLSREDHVHALSQSIAPTMSGAWIFSFAGSYGAPSISLTSSLPFFQLRESDASANNKVWCMFAQSEQLLFQAIDDGSGGGSTWLSVDRTDTTIDSIALTAAAFTVNTVPLTPVSSTFTITAGGFSGTVNGTARYEKIGNIVVLYIPGLSGTSDSTSFSLSGIPAAIRPARVQNIPVPVTRDNGTDGNLSWVQIATDGTGSVIRQDGAGASTPWTNSGTKALSICTLTYILT